MIKKLWNSYAGLFKAPALHEVVEHEMLQATREAEQARITIRNHEFQLHMAKARMAALTAWNNNAPQS
jgi:hypothetical protein